MNILFLTILNLTDIAERGLYTDLMRKFRDEGHRVHIICPSERRHKKKTSLKIDHGISVLHINTLNLQKTNIVEKGIGTLMLGRQFLKGAIKYYQDTKFDLVLYSTPPITFTKVVRFFKKRDGAKSYLLLKDIFPQNAVDLGLIKKNSLIHRFFEKKERKMYEISDHIGCMSPANADFVISHNKHINPGIVEVNPNSVEVIATAGVSVADKEKVKREYKIPEKAALFIYGGNLGKPQGIDFLISILESNIKNKDVYFLIVGSGTEFSKLQTWYTLNSPENSKLIANLPKNKYDDLLKCCDVGLIFLDKRFTIPNFPSRILSYMEYRMPILAATDLNTDMGKIIMENSFGLWCQSGDLEAFNYNLSQLCGAKDNWKTMGNNGFEYLRSHYSVNNSYQTIIRHFDNV
ncbi:glycosyltransferase family 4 protein [Mucilaginibacter corticis]|uniref:Glycosyltransferase family 4 protein n=1 Tax=Mucilaginibacter corticis TaxID=2597670 RepID=A0A556MTD6_9SPHI|nr:glycosyltransferase family 4 protein [Mucilaginibacter corticis]TSJ43068.1 glycosyltransferase family 4 protein [Mucilaginibacter corticis]